MNSKIKQTIFRKYLSLAQTALRDVENSDIILKNYEEMLTKVIESQNFEDLEELKVDYLSKIQTKQFISIDFDFNNIILGRPKSFYVNTNFLADYRKFYRSNINIQEVLDVHHNDSEHQLAVNKFYEFSSTLANFLQKESDFDLNSAFDEFGKNRMVIELKMIKNSSIENLLLQYFLLVLISTADFPEILKEYLFNFVYLLEFFIATNKIQPRKTTNLKFLLKKLIEATCVKTNFIFYIIEVVNNFLANPDIITELALFLSHVLLFVFENTRFNFLRKVVFSLTSNPELFAMSERQLQTLRDEIVRTLRQLNSQEISHKSIVGIWNVVYFLFNLKKTAVVVFDENINLKTSKKRFDNDTTVLIVNESNLCSHFLILNEQFSEIACKLLVSSKQVISSPDENFTEGSLKRR